MIIMSSDEKDFVYIMADKDTSYPSLKEHFKHCGKWMIYAEKKVIDSMVPKVRSLVGKHDILEAKFSKIPALEVPEGFTRGKDYVMIVYCDDRKNKGVREILERELKVDRLFWKYDRLTLEETIEKGEKVPEEFLLALRELGEKE